ncbi:MAG: B12-binding domain-containing protein [Pirellulales bacterium]|nr:B12-binding domain-containing protein [Pirellulales bacterium]
MNGPSVEACARFVEAFDRLMVMVRERLELEWRYHKRPDLRQLAGELFDHAVEFGSLLRVVFRHGLMGALEDETGWFAAALRSRGSEQDALTLLLDSWIVAIQGTIRPPECNELAEPLQRLRANLPQVMEIARARYGTPPTSEIGDLVGRLIQGDLAESQAVVHSLLTAGTSHTAVITEWLLPAMREVGRRWENNELAIFQEHLATETLRRLLAGLTVSAGESEPLRRTAIVSCVQGDEHQLLPLALGIFLELRGWRVRSLGGGLPPREIAAAVAAFSPVALFLSFSMLSGLDEALETISCVFAKTPPCRILIGGRGAVTARALLERAGARVAVDFEEAHRAALEEVPRA